MADYIASARSAGQPDQATQAALLSAGWPISEVAEAFDDGKKIDQAERALPGFRQLVGESWNIYKKHFVAISLISAIPAIVALLGGLAIYNQLVASGFFDTIKAAAQELDLVAIYTSLTIPMTTLSALSLVVMLIAIACQGIIVFLANDPELTWLQALALAGRNLFKIFWINILFGTLVSLGFLLLIPGIIMTISYSFALMVLADEGIGGWAALRKSAAYTKGQWQKVASVYLIITLLLGLVGLIPFVGLVSYMAMPAVLTIFSFVLYKHLKAIKLAA